MSPWNSNEEDFDKRNVCPLDVAASYLKALEDDLTDALRDKIENLVARYESAETERDRERFWEEIRYTIRRFEGGMSDSNEFSPTFSRFARQRFEQIWNSLSFNERSSVVGDYKFECFGDGRVRRPDFLNSRRIAWCETKRRVEYLFGDFSASERERINARMVDSSEVAFAMYEFVYAIDDYDGDFDNPEVSALLDKLMDEIREIVYARPKTVPSSTPPDPIEQDELENATEDEDFETTDEPSGEETNENDEEDDGIEEEDEEDEFDSFERDEDSEEEEPNYDALAAKKPDGYYPIDENAAANAKRAISFDPYIPNSQTNCYRREVDDAREIAEAQKRKVEPQFHSRIDRALERFERRLANWYDRRNAAEAYCPSILIAGPANFPRERHQKKMARLSALFAVRDKIFASLTKLEGIGTAGISSDDPDAVEKLEAKLRSLKEAHEEMKRANAYLRRQGSWDGYDKPEWVKDAYDSSGQPTYFYLTNSNQEMRRLERRIELLKRQAATDYGDGWKFDGGIVKVNKQENRLQIFFDAAPDRATRAKLKGRGFHWEPGAKAWQRQLSPDAIWAGKHLGYIPQSWVPKTIKKDATEGENEANS